MRELACPRCLVALEAPSELLMSEDLDHTCPQCHGAWVEGSHVGLAYPALRRHATRIAELLSYGAKEEDTLCPHCRTEMLEFPFFDLQLDLCEHCHGMWVDGHEAKFVKAAASDADGLPVQRPTTGYRANAAPTVETERVRCTECAKEVHPRRTLLTADGAVCDHCVEIDRMSDQLHAEHPWRVLASTPGKLLSLLSKLLDADGKFKQRGNPK